jgi:hypothetical protein
MASPSNCKLYLKMQGADGSTTFTDSSGVPHTVTAVGNAQIDTAQKVYSVDTSSGLFDGTGDYLTIPDSTDWYLAADPFTIRGWVKTSSGVGCQIGGITGQWVDANNYWYINLETLVDGGDGYTVSLVIVSGGVTKANYAWTESGTDHTTEIWRHIEIVRTGTSVYFFFGGVAKTAGTKYHVDISTNEVPNLAAVLTVGACGATSATQFVMNGWLSHFEIWKGEALHTADFTPPTVPTSLVPIITTEAGSSVSATGFTGNGTIVDDGGAGDLVTRRGLCYKVGAAGDPLTSDSTAYDDSNYGTGAYTKAVTGLTGGTNYRVRAYAVNFDGTGYGDTVDVLTSSVAATITTEAATVIAATSCVGNGTIVSTGGANPTIRGFCYKTGTTLDPTTSDSEVHDDGDYSTGTYTKAITGLTAGTAYRVRAYVTNSVDTSYGVTVQITTTATGAPIVTTQAGTSITTSGFVANGNVTSIGNSDVTTRGFCYKKAEYGVPSVTDSTKSTSGTFSTGAYTETITGLLSGINYNVKAYATNTQGTSYGDMVTVLIAGTAVAEEPTIATPLDTNTPEATHVAWINSRFVANEINTNRFDFTDTSPITSLIENNYWSSADNPVTCDSKGDKLTALFTAWQEIYAWGTQGLQVFQDDGVTPFVNVPGAAAEAGLEAIYSVTKMDNTIFALCVVDKKRVAIKLQGRAPQVISEPIASILSEMDTISDAIGDIISVGGLAIWLVNFPSANQSWAYDYKNDVWLRWGYFNATSGKHDMFIGQHYCFVKKWNKHLIMSRIDGRVYEMSRKVYDDAENDMISYRRTGWLDWGDISKIKHSRELFLKTKTFSADGTTTPTMLLRWRDDGYPKWSRFVELSLDSKYFGDFIIKLSRMGSYHSRQYEFRLSDEVDMALVSVQENFK